MKHNSITCSLIILGVFIGQLAFSPNVSADEKEKDFTFEPAFRVDIGHVDWSPDGVEGESSASLGKKRYENGDLKSLGVGAYVSNKFTKDDQGNQTYRFTITMQESKHPNVFKNYQMLEGVPPYPGMGVWATYTVKLGDVIMLPHGYLYRVRLMEEKTVDLGAKLKNIPYVGVVLQLVKDDDPVYEGLSIDRNHVYMPFEGGGRLFRFGVKFREARIHPENTTERDAILCKIKPMYSLYQGNHVVSHPYELEIAKKAIIPLYDVAFRVADIQLPNPDKKLQGWVQINPHPVPLATDIPLPAYVRDAK